MEAIRLRIASKTCTEIFDAGPTAVARLPKAFRPSTATRPLVGPRAVAEGSQPPPWAWRRNGDTNVRGYIVRLSPQRLCPNGGHCADTSRGRLRLVRPRNRDEHPGAPRAAPV